MADAVGLVDAVGAAHAVGAAAGGRIGRPGAAAAGAPAAALLPEAGSSQHEHRGVRAVQRMVEFAPASGSLALWVHHRDLLAADAAAAGPPGDSPVWTDGLTICYRPAFDALPLDVQTGWVAHQVLHVALRHAQRQIALQQRLGDVDAVLFNLCADAIVNSALSHLRWLRLPAGALRLEEVLDGVLRIPAATRTAPEAALLEWDVERLYGAVDDRRAAAAAAGAATASGATDGATSVAGTGGTSNQARAGTGTGAGANSSSSSSSSAAAAAAAASPPASPSPSPSGPASASSSASASPSASASASPSARASPPASASAAASSQPLTQAAADAAARRQTAADAAARQRSDGPRAARLRALGGGIAPDLHPGAGAAAGPEAEADAMREWGERLLRAHAGDGQRSLLRTLLADVPRVRTPWEQVLRMQCAHALAQSPGLSWSRPTRSYTANQGRAGPNRRLPWEPGTASSRVVPRLVLVVDNSGSIDDGLLGRFNAEIHALLRRLETALVLVVGDCQVRSVRHFEPGRQGPPDLRALAAGGGGGTDFTPLLEEAERHRPDLIIVLTDLDGPARHRPRCRVLWAVPETRVAAAAPFGRLLVLR